MSSPSLPIHQGPGTPRKTKAAPAREQMEKTIQGPQVKQKSFAIGDHVILSQPSGEKLPAIVRFVGDIGRYPNMVGLEFLFAVNEGCHDGFSDKAQARGFTCPPGKGCYIRQDAQNVQRVSEKDAAEANWVNILAEIARKLEERMEDRVLTDVAENACLEAILKAHGYIASVCVKRWVPAQKRYLFFDRTNPSAPGRAQAPRNATILPQVEGGPEMMGSVDSTSGPQLLSIREGTLTQAEADAMFEHIINAPNEPLQANTLLQLLFQAVALMKSMPSLVRVPVPEAGRVIVLGDTHGHLKDVIHVFKKFGPPSPSNVYIFNGDLSDRADIEGERGGQQSVNIWCLALCYKMVCPGSVHINRGNHEDWQSNMEQGPYGKNSFHAEVTRKYNNKNESTQIKNAFNTLFHALPLATVVGDLVVVVHGGLSRIGFQPGVKSSHATCKEIEALNRNRDIPATPQQRADCIMMDLLWSDPHQDKGIIHNPRGPNIVSFGGDVTENWLQKEGLVLLIRSHDWPKNNKPHGYHWKQKQYGQKIRRLEGQESICLEVFTASDYCGTSGNNGSLVVLRGDGGVAKSVKVEEWTHKQALTTWMSVKNDKIPSPSKDVEALAIAAERVHDEYLWALKGLIQEKKQELFEVFRRHDVDDDFHVPISVWKNVCDEVIGSFPWEMLLGSEPSRSIASKILRTNSLNEEPLVNYTEFLGRYQIRCNSVLGNREGFRRQIASMIYNSMMLQDQSLRDTIATFDQNGDGVVSLDEFQSLISHVIPCISPCQTFGMMRSSVAHSENGMVKVHELLDSLVLRFASFNSKPAPSNASWITAKMHQVGKDIIDLQQQKRNVGEGSTSVSELLSDFFVDHDTDRSGFLELGEVKTALRVLPSCQCETLSEADLDVLVQHCDLSGDGRLNYLEFLADFYIEPNDPLTHHVCEDVLESFFRILYFVYRPSVAKALEHYIVPGSHMCTIKQFGDALRAVNTPKGLLTEEQINILLDTLDCGAGTLDDDAETQFDFAEYFASFELIDTDVEGWGPESDSNQYERKFN